MAWTPLPVTGPPHQNLSDEKELDTRSSQVMDAYVDEAGFTVKRPGLLDFVTLGTNASVDGLYWWDEAGKMLAVSGTNLYSISDSSGTLTLIATERDLPSGNRVSFATVPTSDPTAVSGTEVLLASGMTIHFTNGNFCVPIVDPDAPTQVRSLTVYDQYAIAPIEGTGIFAFSEVGDAMAWRAQDIASAEARPDRLVAVLGTLDGFVLFGKTSTEFWLNDGVSPFTRVKGLTYDRGCGARYSPARLGDTWLWLDDKRFVLRATLNKIEEVSGPVNKELQALSSVEDALGDIMTVNGWTLYVLTFPLSNRTFVYDLKQNSWTEWGQWDSQSSSYLRFLGNAYAYSPAWNLHLVGDKANGKVYTLSDAAFTDNDSTLRSLRRTGYITHGSSVRKRCKALRLRLKRSVATGTVPSPTMRVRWREANGAWSIEHPVSLGEVGQHEVFMTLHQCGSYRARQYEFSHSDATSWILMGVDEDVELLVR